MASPDRRAFLKTLAAASMATAASTRRVPGANDRVRVGFIGIGLIGKRHLLDFQAQPDCEIAGISEVSDDRMDEGVTAAGNNPARFPDFRKMLERPDIDAVVVSTPDHWHALMTILACAAGKDVYVEKPLTHAHREGEWMLEAANANKRVVQVGTQQRSGRHYQRARSLVRDGHIGDVRGASIGAFRNITPGFTKPVGSPLSAAQWDMWLGPAPKVPFDPARSLYHFRWFSDYSGGQTTNLLAHEIDIVQWVTGEIPKRVAAFAQRRSLTGFGETPDILDAIFDYPSFLASWSSREVAAGGKGGLEIYGTKGTLSINRRGFEITPDKALTPESQIPRFTQPQTDPGPVSYRTEAVKDEGYDQVRDQFQPHVRDFVDAIRSRKPPVSDLASAHQTSLACHLANVAARLGRVVNWDATRNAISGDADANALLTKTYRAPWDRELAAVVKVARG
jgi:predicted dehydrogenase